MRIAETLFESEGKRSPDIELSVRGKNAARYLSGEFDIVLCSPLRAAIQTLSFSRFGYHSRENMYELREIRDDNIVNFIGGEPFDPETPQEIARRIDIIKKVLEVYKSKRILIISHYSILLKLTGKNFQHGHIIEI